MNWVGDYPEDFTTVCVYFTTHDGNGAPVAPLTAFEAADVSIYKNGSATQKTSTNGVTMTSPFDSIVGLHCVVIDTSNDTGDSGFWTTGGGGVYTVILNPDTETVNGQVALKVLATFGICLSPALRPTAAGRTLDVTATGAAGIDWGNVENLTTGNALTGTTIATTQKVDIETIKTRAVVNGGTVTFPTDATLASTTGAVGSVTGAVGSVTGLTASNLDATVSSRLAAGSYTAPSNLTAAQIATGVWQDATAGDFTTSGSIGKSLFTSGVLPGAAGGLFIAGTNAATTITTALTTTFTGNLTGNLGGNVTGSIGSLATQAKADVNAEADTALADYDAPTHTELTAELATADDAVLAEVALVKTQTDKLTFAVANKLDVNILYVNGVAVTGAGTAGNAWGPA